MTMQIFNPVDPTMIIIYAMILTALFLVYVPKVQHPSESRSSIDDISSMVGGRIEEITTGAVQESMPAHLVSVEEEREEHEGEDLWS